MIQHEVSVHLNQPVERVFAFLMDTAKLTSWQANLIKIEQTTEGPLHTGSRFHEVRRLGRKATDIEGEVTVLEPNRRLETKTLSEPHVTVNYFFEPEENGTRLTRRFIMPTQCFMRLMEPVIGKSIKKDAIADFETLKRKLEN
jgi:uncharacterized protein YndB with AHSA1/START domain